MGLEGGDRGRGRCDGDWLLSTVNHVWISMSLVRENEDGWR